MKAASQARVISNITMIGEALSCSRYAICDKTLDQLRMELEDDATSDPTESLICDLHEARRRYIVFNEQHFLSSNEVCELLELACTM